MAKSLELQLRDVKRALMQATKIVDDMELGALEVSELKAAANQATEAATCLNRLLGQVDQEPKERTRKDLLEMFNRFNEKITDTSLSKATIQALLENKINHIHQLIRLKETDLLIMPGIGRARVQEIKRVLHSWNMDLDMPPLA